MEARVRALEQEGVVAMKARKLVDEPVVGH